MKPGIGPQGPLRLRLKKVTPTYGRERGKDMGMEMKKLFALRLRQWAERLDGIMAAINRVDDLELGDDESPSKYTPSRRESLEALDKGGQVVKGYCLAVDGALGREHGHTEGLFYRAMEQGRHNLPDYEIVNHDSGYMSDAAIEAAMDADATFAKALDL